MKLLGFLISLLLHLLFFLLIITVQFPVIVLKEKPQIIQIVPISPPLTVSQPLRVPAKLYRIVPMPPPPTVSQPPQAPAKVYVRPFFLKGGTRGNARGQVSGRSAGAKAGLPPNPVLKGGSVAPTARPAPVVAAAEPGISPATTFKSGAPGATGKGSSLTVNLGLISQLLREQKTSGDRPGNSRFTAEQAAEGLPFGDHHAGGAGGDLSPGGDGTSSYALGGDAYFDSRGYDITPWAKRMVYRVKKNWIPPALSEYALKGVVGIYLRIGRDGTIGNIHIRKTSGIRPLDQAAFNAIELSVPLPPLPDDFPNADLPAYLLFYYN
jgi:hypothetical protein